MSLSELEQCRVKQLAQRLTYQHRLRSRVLFLLVRIPKLYPLQRGMRNTQDPIQACELII